MIEKNDSNLLFSLDFSNKQLTEIPQDLYDYKLSLYNLDISGNPLINLDEAIKVLSEFQSLKKLKINVETGDEAKKIIESLPNLIILNDHIIHEEENEIEEKKIEEKNKYFEPSIEKNININYNLNKKELAQSNSNNINYNNKNKNNNNNKNLIKI